MTRRLKLKWDLYSITLIRLIESKTGLFIWTINSLLKAMNKRLTKLDKLAKSDMIFIIRVPKKTYIIFRNHSFNNITEYIFIKKKQ